MRVTRLVGIISAVLLFVPQLGSQQTATTQTNSQAAQVLQSAFGALGGQTASPPTSLVATGSYIRQPDNLNLALPIKIEVLGTQSLRWDTSDVNGTVTLVVSPASSWMQGPDGGRALAVGETFGRGSEVFPFLQLSRWLSTSGMAMTFVGTELSSGRTLNHVSVVAPAQSASGPRMANSEVWTDAQTNLPTRIRVSHSPTDRRVSVSLDLNFSDYRSVNGVLFPFSIVFSIGNHTMGQIQFQSITLNAPVSANDFVASGL